MSTATRPDRFDAIVVGSGPGGATVARELTRSGWNVLILEQGGAAPVSGSLRQTLRELGRPGRSLHVTGHGVAVIHGVTLGGSSIYYYGTATEPPYEMFDRYGIDLRPTVAEARSEMAIGPLPEHLVGDAARRLMDAGTSIGLPWHRLDKFMDPSRFDGNGWLDFFGAPTFEAKWSARLWIDEAVANGATLITNARVHKVLVDRGRAVGAAYRVDNDERVARAPVVIAAAGGIGTPVLLRATGLAAPGFDFFDDPLVSVMGQLDGLDAGPEVPMTAGAIFADDGYVMTDMRVPRALYQAMAAQVGRFDCLGAHRRTLQIMVKVRDELSGRVTAAGRVHKPLTRADRALLQAGTERARAVLAAAGARKVFRSWYVAAHPGGTAKLGEVVDSALETGYSGLYVCDASVIPEAWGLPPTLTIIGLGKHLARGLLGPLSNPGDHHEEMSSP